ncbi:hypothetical protein CLU79DRAFT_693845, partial [Phycomyces nitens]
ELSPIEQFWAIVKGKMKRDRLMNEENLSSRITDACNDILISDLSGFCNHSKRQIVNFYIKTLSNIQLFQRQREVFFFDIWERL